MKHECLLLPEETKVGVHGKGGKIGAQNPVMLLLRADVCRFMPGRHSAGGFVVIQTTQNALAQTWVVPPATH